MVNTINNKKEDGKISKHKEEILNEHIEEMKLSSAKLAVCIDLYDELKTKKIESHEQYLINRTKLKFLQDEILKTCDSFSNITKKREEITKTQF